MSRWLCALGLAAASCAPVHPATPSQRAGQGEERVWSYRVEASPGAHVLSVQAELPIGVPAWLGVDRFAHPFLEELDVEAGAEVRRVERRGDRWHVPECRARGCRLRYSYQLGRAAGVINRFGFAAFRAGVLLAPPSTWLLHPHDYSGSDRYRFHVTTAPGESFVTGVHRSGAGEGSYEAAAELLFEAPYSGFGRFRHERLPVGQGVIRMAVSLAAGRLAVSAEALRAAVRRAAAHVTSYYGRFPSREVALMILPVGGAEVFGMQLGNGGATILCFLGREVGEAELEQDWVLTHEMFHLGFPTLDRRHLWLAEGLATYQEPLARARAGLIDAEQLWRELMTGMPKGLPEPADGGLDASGSWGRIYWGGALFCLLADLTIRAESHNRHSLETALRAVLGHGGDASARWTMERVLEVADAALGRPTLSRLYREHGPRPINVDLKALWRKLGVEQTPAGLSFDEDAEWAPLRRALLEPPPARRTEPESTAQGEQLGLAAPGVPKSAL